jgi:hypothetical protein
MTQKSYGGYLDKNPLASFPRTTREGHGKDAVEETPRLGVISRITLRMSESFPRTTRKGYGKDFKKEASRLVQH